jgi:CSLREA domain-containing protein
MGSRGTQRGLLAGLVVLALAACPQPADAATYVVDSTGDDDTETCLPAAGGCTLREALTATAASAFPDTIRFQLPDGAVIAPASPLPAQGAGGGPLTITGQTSGELCAEGGPRVNLDGRSAGAATGLDLAGTGSAVCGLAVFGWAEDGIRIGGAGGSVRSSHVGTDTDGGKGLGNGRNGIVVEAPGATIGEPARGNLIVGNGESGVSVGPGGASGTVIAANRIGTGPNGADPNDDGVTLAGDGTMVGGETDGTGNLIAGNTCYGINVKVEAQSNPLLRNSIYDNRCSNIGLGGHGIDFNKPDLLDVDEGGNRLQNAPSFQQTYMAATNPLYTLVYPNLVSTANETFRLEWFYTSEKRCTPDPNDGQTFFMGPAAEHFLGAIEVTTDERGYFVQDQFDPQAFKLPPAPPDAFLSATATDSQGNTSRIGGCAEIYEIPLPELEVNLVPVDDGGHAKVEVTCVDRSFDCNAGLRIRVPTPHGAKQVGLLRKSTIPNDGRPHVRRVHLRRPVARRVHRLGRLPARLTIAQPHVRKGKTSRVRLVAKRHRSGH